MSTRGLGIQNYQQSAGEEDRPVELSFANRIVEPSERSSESTYGYGTHTDLPRIVTTSTSPPVEEARLPSPPTSAGGLFSKRRSPSSDAPRSDRNYKTTDRGLHETKKLLSHLLDRLENRPAAPDIFSKHLLTSTDVQQHRKRPGLEVFKSSAAEFGIGAGIEEKGVEPGWDTEPLVVLLGQLLGLLSLATKQSLDLFRADSFDPPSSISPASPEHTQSPTPKRRVRLPSMSPRAAQWSSAPPLQVSSLNGPRLLKRMIGCLRTLISDDCLHQVRHPRPALPPNSLQAMCLELASCLLVAVDNGQEQVAEILRSVTTAFYSFPTSMVERLLTWFEGAVGASLSDLDRLRSGVSVADPWTDPFAPPSVSASIPILSLSVAPESASPVEVQSGWKQWASPISGRSSHPPQHQGVLSTHTAGLGSSQYYLAAVFAPLIQAVTSTVDLSLAPLTTIHRVHRLLAEIIKAKPDASLDLLEVVAYGTPDASYSAWAMLATFWPKAVGHVAVAKPFPLSTYEADLCRWEIGRDLALPPADAGHEYTPWRSDGEDCGRCSSPVVGFGITCVLCQEVMHLDCYGPPDQVVPLAPVLGQASPRPSAIKFSHVLRPSKATSDMADGHMVNPTRRVAGQHHLMLVNMFTLALCAACQSPLWGLIGQAYSCGAGCHQLFHPRCVDLGSTIPCNKVKAKVVIRSETFRQSYEDHYSEILFSDADLGLKSVDEIAILYGTLWTQLELLENGLAHSSLVIQSKLGDRIGSDDLDLPRTVSLCLDILQRGHAASSALTDYQMACSSESLSERYMHNRAFLSFVTALVRSPASHHQERQIGDSGLLHVGGSLPPEWEEPTPAYETLQLGVIRGVLRNDFDVSDKKLAALFLNHLHHMGHLQACSLEVFLTSDADNSTACSFPIPTLLDASTAVEILLSAIEVSLGQLDLAINEHGFMLLVKRAWPSALCSGGALQRLAEAIIRWIVEESSHLLIGIEQYASNHRPMPGLRLPPKGSASISTTSVAQYKADRRLLLTRQAIPWLQALYDLDAPRYISVIYDIANHLALDIVSAENPVDLAQECLGCIARLHEAQASFSGSPELLIAWLRDLGELTSQNVFFKQLPRLLQSSTSEDATTAAFWAYTRNLLNASRDDLGEALSWFRVLAQSGVHLPYDVLLLTCERLCRDDVELSAASCDELLDFMISLGHSQLGRTREEILGLTVPVIRRWLDLFRGDIDKSRTTLLNQMLGVILTAYGVMGNDIPAELQSTRQNISTKSRMRHVTEADPLPVDLEMIEGLAGLLSSVYVAGPIARFLLALVSKSSNVANADYLIRHLSPNVFKALWTHQKTSLWQDSFLDLLLVCVSVVPEALLLTIEADEDSSGPWLWRFIVDLVERDAREGSRPWRKAVVDVLLLFLNYISTSQISTEREALRRSILPAHLAFMTTCFEDALIRSGPIDRLDLLSKLHKQRRLFTTAPVIGWATLETLAAEQTLDIKELQTRQTDNVERLRLCQIVRAGVIGLALFSMSSGAKLTGSYHKRLMAQAKYAFEGIGDDDQRDALTLLAPSLRVCMDSPIRIDIGRDSYSSSGTVLLGAPLIESILGLISLIDFAPLSFSLQRCLLDCSHAVMFKHIISENLAYTVEALQALTRIVNLDISVDIRLQALSVLESALNRCPQDIIKRALPEMFAVLSDVIASKQQQSHDPVVAGKVRTLLRLLQEMFNGAGLYLLILKRPVSNDGPSALDVLRLIHQRDYQPSSPHYKSDSLITDMVLTDVFNGLLKATRKTSDVNIVLRATLSVVTLSEEVAAKSAESFGHFLTKLGRHVAEWAPNEFDPNPVLAMCSKFLLQNPSPTLELSSQAATFLVMALAKFDVKSETLERLLECACENLEHPLWLAIHAQLVAATRGLPVTDLTLLSLLQALVDRAARMPDNAELTRLLLEISPGCLGILLRPSANGKASGNHLAASKTAARVILMSDEHDGKTLALVTEALGRQAVAVQLRVFSFLSMSALDCSSVKQRQRLVALLPIYGRTVGLAYKACADFLQSPGRLSEGAELLTRAFLVTRAAVILAPTPKCGGAISAYWARVWPDLERLVYISLRDECKQSPLCATLHSCFLDLVVYMAAYSPQLMLSHGDGLRIMSVTLESESSATPSKLKRALAALQRPTRDPPSALGDLQTDLAATERLLALRGMD